jgi:hypothetical protein
MELFKKIVIKRTNKLKKNLVLILNNKVIDSNFLVIYYILLYIIFYIFVRKNIFFI